VSALEAVHDTIIPVAAPAATNAERTLEGLYERHFDRIFGFCRRRLRSQQEAEDATQTTFLQAFRALQRGVVPVSEEAWLFKIAENVCLSAHRTNGRRSERELSDGAAAIELAPARDSGSEALVGLDEALAAIPRRQRDVFVLRELRGLSYKEIAVSLELSVTAVEMLVFRARRSLARALEGGAGLKGRVAGLFDLAAAVNALKTVFGGVGVAKLASTAVAVVAVAALPAGDTAREASPGESTEAHASRIGTTVAVERSRHSGARASSPVAARRAGVPPRAEESRRGRPRAPRPDGEATAPAAPPAAGTPAETAPQPQPNPRALPAVEPPTLPAPVQLPQPPPVELPKVPDVPPPPQLPQVPVDVPALPDPLPDPGELDLPATPTLP
jgi:RNA polymerase sigma-70 factor, ECF subfamily